MNKAATVGLVGIVDDDESVRNSISSLLRSAGYKTLAFESAEAFLDSGLISDADSLVLDVKRWHKAPLRSSPSPSMMRLCSARLVRLRISGSNRLPTTLNSENLIQRKRGSMNMLVSTSASERFSASRASLGHGEQEINA